MTFMGCGYRFREQIKTFSPDQKVKSSLPNQIFVCDECQEVFLDQAALKTHSKSHLVCKICKRVCDSKSALKRHVTSHK